MNNLKTDKIFELLLAIACCFVVSIAFRRSPLFATYGAIGLAIIYMLVSRVHIALFLIILFMPLQRSVFHNYGLVLSWFPVIVLSVVLALYLLRNINQIGFSERLPQWLLLFLLGYIVITLWIDASIRHGGTVLVSPMKGGGVAHFRYILQTLLFFWIISFLVSTKKQLRVVTHSLAITLLLVSIVGVYELLSRILTGSSYISHLFHRFYPRAVIFPAKLLELKLTSIFMGWVGNFQFGNFLVVSGLITFPYFFAKAKSTLAKMYLVAFLAICFCCLYFTYSVGSWLAGVAGLVSLQFLFSKGKRPLLMGMSIIIVFVIVILYLWPSVLGVLPEDPQRKAMDFTNFILKFESPQSRPIRIRMDLIKAGLQMFLENPLFGKGFATYSRYLLQSNVAGVYETDITYTHNSYILILAELGLIGMILFLLLMYTTIRTGFLNMKNLKDRSLSCLQLGTLAAIFSNVVSLWIYETWLFNLNLWLPMGLTLAIKQVIKNEAEGQN